uniref:Uncharacterized protein n=1 Tax=Babesia bovis TaxID=5865 RepID=S6BHC3_BABBO|nr:hypothetical protein [Babesia bovis]
MLHMLLLLCAITCISDIFGCIIKRMQSLCEKMEKVTARPNEPMVTANGEVPNVMDMIAQIVLPKLNIFGLIRMFLGLVGVLVNLIMPYFLLSKFTKYTSASYQRQHHSYGPFMIIDFGPFPTSGEDLAAEAADSDKKVEDIHALKSFNRYIGFMVAKVAVKAIYSTFHAAISPRSYLKHHANKANPPSILTT